MMAQKPLMLKDYLELDSNFESCASFRLPPRRPDGPTVRHLLEAELCGGGKLTKSRSRGAMTRISAVINAVRLLPFSSSAASRPNQARFLPRTISKKLKRSFWKKREADEEKGLNVRVKDSVRLRSFDEEKEERRSLYFPSPVVSSCSSFSDRDSSGSDFLLSSSGSSEFSGENEARKSPNPNPNRTPSPKKRMGLGAAAGDDARETAAGHRESKEEGEMECHGCQSEEEKEQLSPVSVMDFPYQEDEEEVEEEEATSACFQQSLANIERTKYQLLQKIRRFESLAELDPVDLDQQRFASFEDPLESDDHVAASDAEEGDDGEEEGTSTDEKTAWDLLRRLNASSAWAPAGTTQKLLIDFFVEGLSCSRSINDGSRVQWTAACPDGEALLRAASEWMDGAGWRGVWEVRREAEIKEMDRNGGWRSFEDGKGEVAAEVEHGVLGWLVEELVLDLVQPSDLSIYRQTSQLMAGLDWTGPN